MKNLNEELKNLNNYNYHVSADFSKKVMRKIRKEHVMGSMKYVVSFASLVAVSFFAVVLYTNPGFKGVTESNNMLTLESNQNSISNTSSKDDHMFNEYYQDSMQSVKDDGTDSVLFEESKETNRTEGVMATDKAQVNGILNETDKIEANESNVPSAAGSSQKNEKEIIKIKLEKAGFNVIETETGLQVKGNKEEKQKLEDLLKDENVKIKQIEENKIEIKF